MDPRFLGLFLVLLGLALIAIFMLIYTLYAVSRQPRGEANSRSFAVVVVGPLPLLVSGGGRALALAVALLVLALVALLLFQTFRPAT